MIVFQNSLITITYAPETDILSLEWPYFEENEMLEVKESIRKLIEVLKYYDVKKLLIDARNARVDIPYSEYNAILKDFEKALRTTRLQKFARVITYDPVREMNVDSVRKQSMVAFQYQDFTTKEEALRWLEK